MGEITTNLDDIGGLKYTIFKAGMGFGSTTNF
jgi:hypothetical protein